MGNPPHSAPRVPRIEKFGTVLECMDGRPQRKVADYLSTSFGVRNLDTITTAGLVRHLAGDTEQTDTILANLGISVEKHGSHQIAVAAHHDCAGNPVSDRSQKQQVAAAMARIEDLYPDAEVVGLWLNEHWIVERIRRV
jgi:carbonic anhydrase